MSEETPTVEYPVLEVPADGIPAVIDTPEALAEARRALIGGHGPIAIDTERAQGYRYTAKAYLIQLRRDGSGTHLIDPVAFENGAPRADFSDMATELEAARWLTYRAAWLRDQGQPFLKEAAMAKLKASRLAAHAASEAVQIHGGVGYMLESPVARFYCDSKVLEIGEGTNEIQHVVIARALGC